ncbi:hypothetical protein HELRODRAFT_176310 [Helobdella robusta]|uniref:Uncharacterized protein n=1 Tax=Helobdella robusta TaxID=6412 RepID=T1FAD8_HELRO|nr:hypothetical protein HELRODRAFT_176310 [Helobdella robusta]ESO00009.1 hypothetical protein HELRODRAFT_176310 [Helobdella robusta]
MAPVLPQCPVCSNHYKITPDGKLCRHGGRVKGQECSGSRKKVDAPQVVTGPPHVAASSDRLIMGAMTAVLKRVPLHDHILKLFREKCSNALHELLTTLHFQNLKNPFHEKTPSLLVVPGQYSTPLAHP